MAEATDWMGVTTQLEILISENNPEVSQNSPQVATVSSVLYMGTMIICHTIMLNSSDMPE
jgi:hypothetical protein